MKYLLFPIIVICVLTCLLGQANSKEVALKGKAGNKIVELRYRNYDKNIRLTLSGQGIMISLSGYDAKDFIIKDINGDGNDEILFLDLSGISVGGELRVLIWNGQEYEEVEEEYSANLIQLKIFNNHYYVLLIQHDTEDLFYVSDILFLKDKHLSSKVPKNLWGEIVHEYYLDKIKTTKQNWKKSRYYAYCYLAYKDLGEIKKANEYYDKARKLDQANPLLRL